MLIKNVPSRYIGAEGCIFYINFYNFVCCFSDTLLGYNDLCEKKIQISTPFHYLEQRHYQQMSFGDGRFLESFVSEPGDAVPVSG